jgi:hypothetical protein
MRTLYTVAASVLATLLVLFFLRHCGAEVVYYNIQPQPQIVVQPQPQIIVQPQPSVVGIGGCSTEQPLKPTANAVNVKWESIFGPRGPMEVDSGSGFTVRHVPVGMRIFWDGKYAWTMEGYKVRFSPK